MRDVAERWLWCARARRNSPQSVAGIRFLDGEGRGKRQMEKETGKVNERERRRGEKERRKKRGEIENEGERVQIGGAN